MLASLTILLACLAAAAAPSPAPAPPAAAARAPGWEVSLVPEARTGGRLTIEGRLLGEDGRPRRGVRMLVHHAAPGGLVCAPEDPRLLMSGVLRTNVLGEFRVHTVMPGMAEGVPHLHFEMELPGPVYRAIPLRLARTEAAGSDTTFEKLPWVATVGDRTFWTSVTRDTLGDYHCRWDLKLAKALTVPRSEAFDRN